MAHVHSAHDGGKSKTDIPEAGYGRLPDVLAVFPVSRASWYAGVKSGRYPRPVKLSPRVSAWPWSEIQKLLADPEHYRAQGA